MLIFHGWYTLFYRFKCTDDPKQYLNGTLAVLDDRRTKYSIVLTFRIGKNILLPTFFLSSWCIIKYNNIILNIRFPLWWNDFWSITVSCDTYRHCFIGRIKNKINLEASGLTSFAITWLYYYNIIVTVHDNSV